jgi:hypothetical protein
MKYPLLMCGKNLTISKIAFVAMHIPGICTSLQPELQEKFLYKSFNLIHITIEEQLTHTIKEQK